MKTRQEIIKRIARKLAVMDCRDGRETIRSKSEVEIVAEESLTEWDMDAKADKWNWERFVNSVYAEYCKS